MLRALLFFSKSEVMYIKTVLVGNNITNKCENSLIQMGYRIVRLPEYSYLPKPVSSHADMLLFYDGKKIITHKGYYYENKDLFDTLGIEIELSDEFMGDVYPNDILFNAVLTSAGQLFSKSEYTSSLIKEKSKKLINVKQGYTACSTCKVSQFDFITTDEGLCRIYKENGINSLLVSKNGIYLPGYDCGFIGGATVVLPEGVCFFGDASYHSDYDKILDFADKAGKKIISLSDEKIMDIGGAVVI